MRGFRRGLWLVLLAAGLSATAQDEAKPEAAQSGYLGVATRAASEVVASQLKLRNGGLVVQYVDRESPAGQVLQRYDVLLKLNDQMLFEPGQLARLVGGMRAGEEVALTVMREAVEQEVRAVLGERPERRSRLRGGRRQQRTDDDEHRGLPAGLEQLFRGGALENLIDGALNGDDGNVAVTIERGDVPMVLRGLDNLSGVRIRTTTDVGGIRTHHRVDGEGNRVVIREQDGDRRMTVHNPDGEVLFEGAVNSDEERVKVPEAFRPALDEFVGDQDEGDADGPDPKPAATDDGIPL